MNLCGFYTLGLSELLPLLLVWQRMYQVDMPMVEQIRMDSSALVCILDSFESEYFHLNQSKFQRGTEIHSIVLFLCTK